jgi:hypothetical protein
MEGAQMRLISFGLMMSSVILLPGLGFAQYGYVRECKETVANQLNVSTLDVTAELGPFRPNGNRIVNWRSQRASDRNGFCEFDTATGELVRAESGRYTGPAGNRRGFGSASGRGRGWNRETIVNAPRVKVDTEGRGEFIGLRKPIRIKRGWVDTTAPQAAVGLSRGDDFKVTFYGPIVQQNGDREFTMEIDNSDSGDATGTATFRLSSNHKKVESISASGQLNGMDFRGSFTH